MRTLEQLVERRNELEDELSNYMWWGNEDDEDYKEEYGREYEHLQNELNGVQNQIWELKNKPMESVKQITIIATIQKQIELHKMMKSNLEKSTDWTDDTKYKMDIFYSGKISALEDVINMFNNKF